MTSPCAIILAGDSNALGLVFFYIFYTTVVFSYRRQKKDYDDRLKIEKADAEEKKKMRQLEREMEGIDDDEEEGRKGEENHGYAIHEVSCSCSILTSLLFLGLEKLGRSLRKLLNSSPTERRGVKNTMLDICR